METKSRESTISLSHTSRTVLAGGCRDANVCARGCDDRTRKGHGSLPIFKWTGRQKRWQTRDQGTEDGNGGMRLSEYNCCF